MFDMGFLPDIRRVLQHLPRNRQTLLFSATMPQEIRGLAGEVLRKPVTVQVGVTAPAVTVSHALYPVAQHLKTPLLLELLHRTDTGSVLVFTRTKHRAKRLAEQLIKTGYRAASLQGNLSQTQRQAAMEGFRKGAFRILVATSSSTGSGVYFLMLRLPKIASSASIAYSFLFAYHATISRTASRRSRFEGSQPSTDRALPLSKCTSRDT